MNARPRRSDSDDRKRVLVTPEGIALPFTLASRGARFGALFIDLALIGALLIAIVVALVSAGISGFAEVGAGPAIELIGILLILSVFLFRNAWFLFFELGPRGATPGKRMTGIRIAARDGGRLTAEMVLARNLLRDIELFLPLVFIASASGEGGDMGAAGIAATAWFLIFALMPCFNKDRLRAGDIIAGTWVVEAPRRKLEAAISLAEGAKGPSMATGTTYRFSPAELAIYGEYELQTLERVLREHRPEAQAAVHEAICRKIGWEPGAGDERAFLEAYYTQLRARLEAGMRLGQRKVDKFG